MSKTPLMILLLFALALGLVALALVLQPGGAGGATYAGAGAPLLDLEPGEATLISVDRPGEDVSERLVRSEPGEWDLALVRDDRRITAAWPILPSRIRPLLQTLADLQAVSPPDAAEDASPGEQAMTITIERGEQEPIVFRLGTDAVGGAVAMQVEDGPSAFVSADIANVFRSPGPRGWRLESAMPGVGVDVSRIRIGDAAQGVTLRKVAGSWSVASADDDRVARADDESVDTLIDTLSSIQIERFLDERAADAPPSEFALARPVLSIRAERDERLLDETGSPVVETEVMALDIGRPSDVSQSRRYASPDEGRTVFEIDAAPLGAVVPQMRFYVDGAASDVEPADVGAVVIERLDSGDTVYRRETEGWETAQGVTAGNAEARVEALLAFLRTSEADVVVFDRPENMSRSGRITLLDFAGAPLERFVYAVSEDAALILHSLDEGGAEGVYRIYATGLEALGPVLAPPAG